MFDRSFFVLDSDWLLCEGAGSVNIQGLHTTTKEVMQKHTQTRGENPCQENKGIEELLLHVVNLPYTLQSSVILFHSKYSNTDFSLKKG